MIRNGKTENLAKLDAHAFFISNAFFKSASPVDTRRKLNLHKTFRRRLRHPGIAYKSFTYKKSVYLSKQPYVIDIL